jgi:hypothetical protein
MSKQNTFTLRILVVLCAHIIGTYALFAQETVTLSGEGAAEIPYEVDEPTVVTIIVRNLESENPIDTTLQVLDPAGKPLAFNDDHHTTREDLSPTDSVLENLPLTAVGTYTLRLNSFNGVSKGEVELRIEAGDIYEARIEENGDTTIISAKLPAYGRYAYTFSSEAGDTLTMTARDTSGTLDPVLRLRDSAGEVVAFNDDHTTFDLSLDTLDAQIVEFIVAETGDYTLEVTDFAGRAGTFELTLLHTK